MASSPAVSIECPECVRLYSERDQLRQLYDLAAANIRPALEDNSTQYLILVTLANEANFDLERAEAEIVQHQHWHASN